MLIYPAIDIMDGCCVRLSQGDFDIGTRYGDPVEQARAFADAGADWIHVVDLDGARAGAARQRPLVAAIASTAERVNLQCGGGVRTAEDVAALLDLGVARVVVGSAAVKRPEEVCGWIERFGPERICAAFDVRPSARGFIVAAEGWAELSDVTLEAAISRLGDVLRHALVTDVSRDGMLAGPNVALYSDLAARFPALDVQASGGVAALDDLDALRGAGAAGAIVGRALYERRFTLEDALAGQAYHRLP